MPNTSSAKKALRQSARKRARNIRHKHMVAEVTKQLRKFVVAGKNEEASLLLPRAYKSIDKATKTRVLKPCNHKLKAVENIYFSVNYETPESSVIARP